MSAKPGRKPFPVFRSDQEAERFVEEADLTDYDLTGFKPMAFEFEPKTARVNMRLPGRLLTAVKAAAEAAGVPYQRFIRQALEIAVERRK
jgi:predicted DNA binding CopG/RHH family protein